MFRFSAYTLAFGRLGEGNGNGDDNDQDEDSQKDKDTQTQTKTNKKCFQDPMYAIFFKSRGFKDINIAFPPKIPLCWIMEDLIMFTLLHRLRNLESSAKLTPALQQLRMS